MAPPVSASPSSETSAKLHPYQDFYPEEQQPGPKYSFETRNTPPGLRVRVDMPGVPKDGVKVVQYDETRTVTFTGKAKTPPVWTEFDTDDSRVYAGYVVLDRDPNNVKSTYEVEDGVLRMFFPNCDGSLHFLSPHNAPVQHVETGLEEEHEHFSDQNISYIHHSPFEPSGIELCSGKLEHINPHLIRGTKGVYEHKVVTVDREHQIYVRVDVPGTYDISSTY